METSSFSSFFLRKIVKENHGCDVFQAVFNRTSPSQSLSNLLATVGGKQANVYDCSHFGEFDLFCHFVNRETPHVRGLGVDCCCWLPDGDGDVSSEDVKDAPLAIGGEDEVVQVLSIIHKKIVRLIPCRSGCSWLQCDPTIIPRHRLEASATCKSFSLGHLLACVTRHGDAFIANWKTGRTLARLYTKAEEKIHCVFISAHHEGVFACLRNGVYFAPLPHCVLSQDRPEEDELDLDLDPQGLDGDDAVDITLDPWVELAHQDIDCIDVSTDAIVVKSTRGTLFVIDAHSRTIVGKRSVPNYPRTCSGRVRFDVCFSHSLVLIGDDEGDIHVYSWESLVGRDSSQKKSSSSSSIPLLDEVHCFEQDKSAVLIYQPALSHDLQHVCAASETSLLWRYSHVSPEKIASFEEEESGTEQ